MSTNHFSKGNFFQTLMLCYHRKTQEVKVFGNETAIDVVDFNGNLIEHSTCGTMPIKYIHHNAFSSFNNFPIPSTEISAYEILFIVNSNQNGFLTINGQEYYKPTCYFAKNTLRVRDYNTNTNTLLFNEYSFDDKRNQNGVTIEFHKFYPQKDGLQRHYPYIQAMKHYLIHCPKTYKLRNRIITVVN